MTSTAWDKEDAVPKGQELKLIELSRGSVRDQETEKVSFDEWDRPGCPRTQGEYRFYNVMWIEWEKDGEYATRRAMGRVVDVAWDTAQLENMDIVLG